MQETVLPQSGRKGEFLRWFQRLTAPSPSGISKNKREGGKKEGKRKDFNNVTSLKSLDLSTANEYRMNSELKWLLKGLPTLGGFVRSCECSLSCQT